MFKLFAVVIAVIAFQGCGSFKSKSDKVNDSETAQVASDEINIEDLAQGEKKNENIRRH